MKAAIWAEYFHMGSTDEFPNHRNCPTEQDFWFRWKIALIKKEKYKYDEHTHLPPSVMLEIRHIFKDLSTEFLLIKCVPASTKCARWCVHGGSQNASESLNSVIWNRIPKIFLKGICEDVYITFRYVRCYCVLKWRKCK